MEPIYICCHIKGHICMSGGASRIIIDFLIFDEMCTNIYRFLRRVFSTTCATRALAPDPTHACIACIRRRWMAE
jgi:hypothetical protein